MLKPQNTLSLDKHDYTLLEEMAYGGQSVIWKAQRHSDGELVALKTVLIYDPSSGGTRNLGQQQSTRTLRTSTEIQELIRLAEEEIRFLDSLGKEAKNYHIATFEDKGYITLNDRPDHKPLKIPMVAMSLYRHDLRSYEAKYADTQSKPRFTIKQLLRWIQQIATALDFIHQFSQKNTRTSANPYRAPLLDQPQHIYVHRDIKPANIMIDQVGDAWLIDFGIVRAAENVLTSTVMASYLYCAPEQRLAQQFEASGGRKYAITPAVDIYSLAVVICRLLGDLPKAQDKINQQKTIDEHENQLRTVSQNTNSNENSHGGLGQIGGLAEQEQANLIRQFESVLKSSSSAIRLDEHRCLPYTAYSVISQTFVNGMQQMLNPNYQQRPNAHGVIAWAQSLYDALHPIAVANDFVFRPVRPKVTLDQMVDCHLRFSGVGLVTPFTWLALKVNNRRYDFSAIEPRMRLNHKVIQSTLLEKHQTYHLSFPLLLPKTGKYQLTLTAYVGDAVIQKETTCEIIHSAEQLWQQGDKVEALRQDLREAWLETYRDDILRKHQRDKPLQKSMALYKAYQQLTDVHENNPLLMAYIDAAENMEFPETNTKSTWFGFRKRTPKTTDRAAPLATEKARWLDDNGETLLDSKTGLMWQKYSLGRSKENPLAKLTNYNWHEAMQQAQQNTCANHHDWRLPTQQELCSVNPSTLKSLEKTLYWTASQVPQPLSSYETLESKVIVVDFGLGTQIEKLTENKEDIYASVYLVRDAPLDDPEAFKTYKANAENTQQDQHINCCAQYQLALCYLHGLGNEGEHPQLAYEWFQQAAEMGHAQAQYQLSGFYQQGKWVDSDHEKAYRWCRKAAEQGHAAAQSQLAWWYQQGIVDLLEADSKKAFFWYQQAAEQGQTYAQSCVASCYFSGLGTTKNQQKATHYAKQAAKKGDKNAQYLLGILYTERCKTTYYSSYGDKAIPIQPSDVFACFKQAADQQHAAAAYNLAYCYLTGFGVEENAEASFQWYQSS
ncbi:MAG TPA: DUF1566 domain-containing protein, partial [Thiothrix sp.]|nr:DUF1566 domain-containing protein [Thiothrix sp.]